MGDRLEIGRLDGRVVFNTAGCSGHTPRLYATLQLILQGRGWHFPMLISHFTVMKFAHNKARFHASEVSTGSAKSGIDIENVTDWEK